MCLVANLSSQPSAICYLAQTGLIHNPQALLLLLDLYPDLHMQ